MDSNTFLLIILSLLIAFGLSYFWYRGGNMNRRLFWYLFMLRGLALWSLALLLINPVFREYTLYTEKPTLNILVDNSASMEYLEDPQNILGGLQTIENDPDLSEAFEVRKYTFADELQVLDSSPDFKQQQTNISRALQRLKKLESNEKSATLLISDGNSTYGGDYQFNTSGISGPVYTFVVGDTTRYEDLYIERVNVNRYAYLKNRFPVEVFIGLEGEETVKTQLEVLLNNSVVYKREIEVNPGFASLPVTIELEAGTAGLNSYRIRVSALENEKNTANNLSNFAVEVIDQRNKIALVSKVVHPDLGSLKNIIEGSGQRSVEVIKPSETDNTDEFDLFILFQPDADFKALLEKIDQGDKNYWLIGGEGTDWNFVNSSQVFFDREVTYTAEDVQGTVNMQYGNFQVEDPGVDEYPPITTVLGDFIIISPYEILLYKTIGGIPSERPLLFTLENNNRRVAILDGNGIWKWRLWHYGENEDFTAYDEFWNKLIQYLSSGSRKERLNLGYEPFYYANSQIRLSAGYYDKNYEFDPGENLQLELKHEDSLSARTIPMMSDPNGYRVNLNGLAAGNYQFTVSVPAQNLSRAGEFSVLEYEVEKQFVNTDTGRMQNLAERTGGKMGRLEEIPAVLSELMNSDEFRSTQKRRENIVPLLEWQWLLFATALLLGVEWFVRKYNGLI